MHSGPIVVATDLSADARLAALRAGALARRHAREVTLVHVVPDLGVAAGLALRAGGVIRDALLALAAELEAASGVPFRPVLEERPVVQAILEASAGAGLLVLGARGENPVRDLAIGTTADRVIRKARLPVLVVRSAPEGEYRRALVPVDFSADSAAALRAAAALAPAASLEAMHVYEVAYEGKARMAGATDEDVARYRDMARAEAEEQMAALLREAREPRATGKCVHGHPLLAIPARAQSIGADLVALGKHGRGPLEELLLGSTTLHVLAWARCDVLVVPAGPA